MIMNKELLNKRKIKCDAAILKFCHISVLYFIISLSIVISGLLNQIDVSIFVSWVFIFVVLAFLVDPINGSVKIITLFDEAAIKKGYSKGEIKSLKYGYKKKSTISIYNELLKCTDNSDVEKYIDSYFKYENLERTSIFYKIYFKLAKVLEGAFNITVIILEFMNVFSN